MKKKVAILLDGGFVQNVLKSLLMLNDYPEADPIYDFATQLTDDTEEIFRIYFYHGEPYKKIQPCPITGSPFDFGNNPLVRYSERLFKELSKKNYVALRQGETVFRGWKLKNSIINSIKQSSGKHTPSFIDNDFVPELDQKGVDIKIGLDVAWLASKKIVDRVILVTGDTDFIPAMKFARKEGIQVVICKVGNKQIKESLYAHADLIRYIDYDNNNWITNFQKKTSTVL